MVINWILGLIATLMTFHLSALGFGMKSCYDRSQIYLDKVRHQKFDDPKVVQLPFIPSPSCINIGKYMTATADQYLTVLLSILGGASFASPRSNPVDASPKSDDTKVD
jgi:hypothetical protein